VKIVREPQIRVRILQLLAKEDRKMSCAEIGKALDVTRQRVNSAVNTLEGTDLIQIGTKTGFLERGQPKLVRITNRGKRDIKKLE